MIDEKVINDITNVLSSLKKSIQQQHEINESSGSINTDDGTWIGLGTFAYLMYFGIIILTSEKCSGEEVLIKLAAPFVIIPLGICLITLAINSCKNLSARKSLAEEIDATLVLLKKFDPDTNIKKIGLFSNANHTEKLTEKLHIKLKKLLATLPENTTDTDSTKVISSFIRALGNTEECSASSIQFV